MSTLFFKQFEIFLMNGGMDTRENICEGVFWTVGRRFRRRGAGIAGAKFTRERRITGWTARQFVQTVWRSWPGTIFVCTEWKEERSRA